MPHPKTGRPALAGLLLTAGGAFLFATKGLMSKALFHEGVDYDVLTVLRAILALPLFLALAWQGGFGALVDFRALELIDVSLERALLFSYPAIVVFYTAIARRRWPEPVVLAALVATYAGIVLVVGAFDPAVWRQNLAGSLMVLFCATTTAAYFLLGERAIPDLGSRGYTIVAMTAATAFVCGWYAATHPRPLEAIAAVSPHGWLLLAALAVLCMFLPTLMQAEGIRRIGAVRGALASTVGPPAALLLGTLALGERPGPWQLVGTALITAGVVLIARSAGTPARRA